MSQRRHTHTLFIITLFLLVNFVLKDRSLALTRSEDVTLADGAILELAVTAPDAPLEFGAAGEFTLNVTNTGDEAATNVTVKLPQNLGIYYTGAIAGPEGVVTRGTAVFGDIAPDETVTVDVPIQIRGM